MKKMFIRVFLFLCGVGFVVTANSALAQAVDPASHLPSWTDNRSRDKIVDFIFAVTNEDGSQFVLPEERIAVFDLDGTLIPEYPLPYMIAYSFQRFQASPPPTRELNDTTHTYLVEGELETAMALNAKRSLELLLSTYAGDTPAKLRDDVRDWLQTPYPDPRMNGYSWGDMVYLPMQELIALLRANGFKIYLVTGSEQEFARVIGAELLGIRPEYVIGSELRQKFEEKSGQITISREARITDFNLGPSKALNIQKQIGRAPLIAVGNSDGDLEMLKLTTQAQNGRLGIFIHHTDAGREFAYDREARTGKLRKGLDQAKANNWLVVNMEKDWEEVFKPPVLLEPATAPLPETDNEAEQPEQTGQSSHIQADDGISQPLPMEAGEPAQTTETVE